MSCTRCGMVAVSAKPTFYAHTGAGGGTQAQYDRGNTNNPMFYAHTGVGGIAPTAAALPVTPPLLPRRKSYTRLFIEASILLVVVYVCVLNSVSYAYND